MRSSQLDLRRQAVLLKILLAPVGVLALLYWAAQKRPISTDNDIALILAGAVVAVLSIIPFGLRFREVLKIIDFEISGYNSAKVLTQSMFYYFFVPLSVGTEVSKFAKLKALNNNSATSSVASAIVLDHLVGLLALVITSICLYLLVQPISVRLDINTILMIIGAGVIALGCLVFFVRSKLSIHVRFIVAKLASQKTTLVIALSYSLLMHIMIAAAVTIGARYWEIDISYVDILFVLTGAFLFQMIPINFVGVGATEVAGVGLYVASGLSLAESLTLVSLLYCYRVLIAIIGGAWEFLDAWGSNPKKV